MAWGALRTLESGAQLRQSEPSSGACTVPSGDWRQCAAGGVPVHAICNSGRATPVQGSRPDLLEVSQPRFLLISAPFLFCSLLVRSLSCFAAIAAAQSFARLLSATQRVLVALLDMPRRI